MFQSFYFLLYDNYYFVHLLFFSRAVLKNTACDERTLPKEEEET